MLPYTYAAYNPYELMYLADQSPNSFESFLQQRDMALSELPSRKVKQVAKKKGGAVTASGGPTKWYRIPPAVFNGRAGAAGAGGCEGIKNGKYMMPPFITKSGNAIKASTLNE